jgi:RNA polymerase sigma-70 factor, ECF subfamily
VRRNTNRGAIPAVNTFSPVSVYSLVGLPRMASRPRDGIDLSRAGLRQQPVTDQSTPEISGDVTSVNAARDGDRDAFARLYDRYARMVHGVLLAKVPISDVDDLVQDVFLLALRRLSTLREPGSFGAWLAAIARNRANDYYRRSKIEDPLTDDLSEIGDEPGNAREGDQGLAVAVLDTIKGLPEAYREPLILRLVEGMTGPEIAARTGLTHGSVRVNLHRGMQMLREELERTEQSHRPAEES